jgi:pilus assembly protein Flp/PilA
VVDDVRSGGWEGSSPSEGARRSGGSLQSRGRNTYAGPAGAAELRGYLANRLEMGDHHMKNMRNSIAMALALAPQGIFAGIQREEGQTLAEYALILALIAVVVVGAVFILGGQINSVFNDIGSKI